MHRSFVESLSLSEAGHPQTLLAYRLNGKEPDYLRRNPRGIWYEHLTEVTLNGDYAAGVVFAATTMVNVETISLTAGHSYKFTTHNATVARQRRRDRIVRPVKTRRRKIARIR